MGYLLESILIALRVDDLDGHNDDDAYYYSVYYYNERTGDGMINGYGDGYYAVGTYTCHVLPSCRHLSHHCTVASSMR